jgi:arylsulfatase
MILQWDESVDIGSDTLTAKLNKLTIKVDRPQLTPEDIKTLESAESTAVDGTPHLGQPEPR